MKRIDTFLELVVNQGGSDLHLVSGNPPRIRLYGDLFPVKYRDLTIDETTTLLYETMSDRVAKLFASCHGVDYAYEAPGLARFRVNAFHHRQGLGAVLRVIPSTVQTLEELEFPAVFKTLCREKNGLILVTGPTGSGKTTTLSAMIDFINRERKGHIITIEDPVEFVHCRQACLVSQREIGGSASSFTAALRSALREDPDVLLVGELRDLETISLAVTAAETGVLILGSLHTNGATYAVDRIINVFPANERSRIRTMLSTSLRGVISQQLVRRAVGKGQLAAFEILINNTATANIIREGKTNQLSGVIERSALLGMQSLDHALHRFLDARLITGNEAYRKAVNKAEFEQFREQEPLV